MCAVQEDVAHFLCKEVLDTTGEFHETKEEEKGEKF
jgi:hypothetical protein